jgi:hypothetical protein
MHTFRFSLFGFRFAVQPAAVDQIEQEDRDHTEKQHEEIRVKVPDVGHDDVAVFGNRRDTRENLLVSQSENHRARQESQETGDDVIQFSFTATGGAGARSVTTQCHADAEDQAAHQVAHYIRSRNVGEGDQP